MDRVSIIALLVGAVLPLLTAAVTKASWAEWAKQLLLAALSGATGAGVDLEHLHGGVSAAVIGANALTAFATAVAVRAGTWKPTGAVATLEAMFIRDTPVPAGNVTSISEKLAGRDTPSPTSPTADSN